ncbi:MAG TPA: 4-hydroxy-3-methylbut-2-enyl diphosphate reductase [Opitutales bacterium]|nr:4-hydroxy-3-methylbut-2-enyl diphosphate reductase [Opitutales bacterium]
MRKRLLGGGSEEESKFVIFPQPALLSDHDMQGEATESKGVTDSIENRRIFVLGFNASHQLLLRRSGDFSNRWELSIVGGAEEGETAEEAAARIAGPELNPVFIEEFASETGENISLFFATLAEGFAEESDDSGFFSIAEIRLGLAEAPETFAPEVAAVIGRIDPHLVRIPYLEKGPHEYNYSFRPERQRNRSVYQIDQDSARLYQSELCQAIKEIKRVNERRSTTPTALDFGAVSYIVPSHFGFCLGVQNAIERAYECLAENPGRRVYLLSELIHNPFVNEDLTARGLRCLQTDRGEPLIDPETGVGYWDQLKKDDVVIIPAFGATDEDKVRLIEKGISINQYDATCMLVEKVWKAAQRFGRAGYTVIIHGKAEHEETKGTFSNASKAAPSLIVRDRHEAEQLAAVIRAIDPAEKRKLFETFVGKHTPGFDVERDLDRIAVVNQTTLLRNETLRIIEFLEEVLAEKFGQENLDYHLNSNSKGDTLCYATQVNQDALEQTLEMDLDFAIVAGGKNSSNTYQLYRMCKERLDSRAFYIQSEKNILSADRILHDPFSPGGVEEELDGTEERKFLSETDQPVRILLTGGASCPDGILQQIIFRINSFFPPEKIRPVREILDELDQIV